MIHSQSQINFNDLAESIKQWGLNLGFQQVGIADTQLQSYKDKLDQWLANN